MKGMAGQNVRGHGCVLAGTNARQLILLEIRVDPETLIGNHADEVRADGHVSTRPDGTVTYVTVDRRANFGVALVEMRGFQIGLCLRDVRSRLVDVGLNDRNALTGTGKVRFRRCRVGLRFPICGGRALHILSRDRHRPRKALISCVVVSGEGQARALCRKLGVGLADLRLL